MPTTTKCKSSHIKDFCYDEETNTLIITFQSGSYVYDDVPPEVHAELIRINEAGESVGKYFQASIKGVYEATKVPPAPYHQGRFNQLAAG
jgi:hypothetical protein